MLVSDHLLAISYLYTVCCHQIAVIRYVDLGSTQLITFCYCLSQVDLFLPTNKEVQYKLLLSNKCKCNYKLHQHKHSLASIPFSCFLEYYYCSTLPYQISKINGYNESNKMFFDNNQRNLSVCNIVCNIKKRHLQ